MNSVDFNDKSFQQSDMYKEFISVNSSSGKLTIRAYAANKALPIEGMKIIVYKIMNNTRVIFYEGNTDNSGLIENISLPTPSVSNDDLITPPSQDYSIEAIYDMQDLLFNIKMYSNISVNQNINVVPNLRTDGNSYGY